MEPAPPESGHRYKRSRAAPWVAAYRWPILCFVAVGFWNTVGAGLLGFVINPPASLYYVQGLNLIPQNHLTKVVHFLGKRGFLANVRAYGGGLVLAVPAKAINVGDVVREAEGAIVPAECFDAGKPGCAIAPVCRLRGVLNDAVQAFYAVLAQYTLEDLVGDRRALAKILFPPPPARSDIG